LVRARCRTSGPAHAPRRRSAPPHSCRRTPASRVGLRSSRKPPRPCTVRDADTSAVDSERNRRRSAIRLELERRTAAARAGARARVRVAPDGLGPAPRVGGGVDDVPPMATTNGEAAGYSTPSTHPASPVDAVITTPGWFVMRVLRGLGSPLSDSVAVGNRHRPSLTAVSTAVPRSARLADSLRPAGSGSPDTLPKPCRCPVRSHQSSRRGHRKRIARPALLIHPLEASAGDRARRQTELGAVDGEVRGSRRQVVGVDDGHDSAAPAARWKARRRSGNPGDRSRSPRRPR